MTYDDTAKKVGVKAIGTVESNMAYDAINYNDPITVGFVQWFGTRAAAILQKMQRTASWTGVAASINNDLISQPSSNGAFWTTRYLSTAEGDSLKPVLNANKVIQNDQLAQDMGEYVKVIEPYGFDKDADTQALLMIMVEYHQSPDQTLKVITPLPAHSSLETVRDAFLADPILGGYPDRINGAYTIIKANDSAGIELPGSPVTQPPNTGGGGSSPPGASTGAALARLQARGDLIIAYMGDGSTVTCYPNGSGVYVAGPTNKVAPPNPGGGGDPNPPVDPDKWVHPLPGSVMTSGYGPRDMSSPTGSFHYGTDFSTPGHAGTIVAPTDLVLTIATDFGEPTAGTYVKGHTVDGKYTMEFCHMQQGSLRVSAGQTVKKGAPIGTEGATGFVTGRHLHFEAYDGNYPDPWFHQLKSDGTPAIIDSGKLLKDHGVTF